MERAGWRALVALLALAMAGAEETGRWRYGSISWRRKDPSNATSYKVIFTIESAWRYSHGSMVKFGTDQKVEAGDTVKILASEGQDPLFAFGDGNVTARYDVEVVKVDTLQDIVVGTSSFEWDYWMAGPWDATLTLCCRVGENQNGMKSVMLRSKVDLSAASVLGSPRVRIVPRVALQATGAGDIAVFEIPTTAAEGFDARSGIVYEAADANFWYSIISNPPNASIFLGVNASSGLASVDVRCYRWGGCSRDLNVIVVVKRQGAWGMVDFVVRVQKNVAGGDAVPMLTLKAPNSIELQGRETSVLRGMPVIKAFADFSVALTFKGQDAMQQPVYFEYNMLPAGAVIGARTLINPLDQVWAQDITWKPSQSQVGEHYICGVTFDGDPAGQCAACTPDVENDETSCVPSCPAHLRSRPLCFNIRVFDNGAPVFSEPLSGGVGLPLNENGNQTNKTLYIDMNFPLQIEVEAGDDNVDDPVMLSVEGVHPEGSKTEAVVDPGSTKGKVRFEWRPARHFGGWTRNVCFRAVDTGGLASRLCIGISVNICRWYASEGQSLNSIALLFGSNYVQMWALNPERVSPDEPVLPGQTLNIGHLYQLRQTDNFRYLSVQFSTTRETIEMLNFGLAAANSDPDIFPNGAPGDKEALGHWAGNEICVLPHSCVDASSVVAA